MTEQAVEGELREVEKIANSTDDLALRVYVTPGTDPLVVRQRILDAVGPSQPRMLVLTNKEVREWILKLTDQWLQLTYSQVLIAVLVAILGIVLNLSRWKSSRAPWLPARPAS